VISGGAMARMRKKLESKGGVADGGEDALPREQDHHH
jgi:hypothetical protein